MAETPDPRRRPDPGDEPIELGGVALTHPNKVLWPDAGHTKRDLAEYYRAVAPHLLPLLDRRALTLRTFPRGIDQPGIWLQHAPKARPDWLPTWRDVASSTGRPVDHVVGGELRTLLWLVQHNAIEVHAWLSRIDRPDGPDFAVIDLDPSEATPFVDVVAAARRFKAELDRAGLAAFPKVTGSSGLHLYIPLARGPGYDAVRERVHALCRRVEAAAPELVTTDVRIAGRGARVFADYAQNSRGRTTVAPYSVRAKPGAPVAAPLRWEDLDDPDLRPNRWTIATMPARIAAVGDLVAPMLACRQTLPAAW
jgi:bifunctional non-homologous end joining protein LigD